MHQHLHEPHKERNKIIPTIILVIITLWFGFSLFQNNGTYSTGTVTTVIEEAESDSTFADYSQTVEVETEGEKSTMEYLIIGKDVDFRKLKANDKVVIDNNPFPQITDKYRINQLLIALIIFVVIAIIFGGAESIYSLVGLAFSTFIVIQIILKGILNGNDPFLLTIVGGSLIATFSVYMAHGIKKRTTVSVIAILLTMLISVISAKFLVNFTNLFGLGSEDAFYLITDPNITINLRGILLAGIIIGTLGVLDDITTSQAAAVDEIRKANPKLSSMELYKRGISVGKEHISSLINTLFLAYVGVSLPLLLIFTQSDIPAWVLINNEQIAEEIVRTIVGSTSLILAVPITTILAAKMLKEQ